jgi:hypothetical protein
MQLENNNIILKIPTGFINTYKKLLIELSNIGDDILNNCNHSCHINNNIMQYWNMFQIACNIYDIDNAKSKKLIDYIDIKLNHNTDSNYDTMYYGSRDRTPNLANIGGLIREAKGINVILTNHYESVITLDKQFKYWIIDKKYTITAIYDELNVEIPFELKKINNDDYNCYFIDSVIDCKKTYKIIIDKI